jgi:hypothetical protein
MPKMPARGNTLGIAQSLRQNEAAQAALRKRISMLDARIEHDQKDEPKARPKAKSLQKSSWILKVSPSLTSEAKWAAEGIMSAFESCGFFPILCPSPNQLGGNGIHIEASSATARFALLIQGAFRLAGVDATLAFHNSAPSSSLTLFVGPTGLE